MCLRGVLRNVWPERVWSFWDMDYGDLTFFKGMVGGLV